MTYTLPIVSVILPVYSGEKFIAAAIESVQRQTLADWELLVIDDGSTDGTAAIVTAFTGDARVMFRQQENRGLAVTRNRGIADARGRLVAFLDADDTWQPRYLERMAAAFNSDPKAVLVYAGWQFIDAEGLLLPQTTTPAAAETDRVRTELEWRNAIIPSSAVATLAGVAAAGGFDEALQSCADWDLWLRLRPHGTFVAVPEVLVGYRTHGENMSNNVERMELERFQVYDKNVRQAPNGRGAQAGYQRGVAGYLLFLSALAYLHTGKLEAAVDKLKQAIALRPGLLEDDELYYELACAFQPPGFRGSAVGLRLDESAQLMHELLFQRLTLPDGQLPARYWTHACLILAQVAYLNGGQRGSAGFALQAARHGAWDQKVAALRVLARAMLPRNAVRRLRGRRGRLAQVDRPNQPSRPL